MTKGTSKIYILIIELTVSNVSPAKAYLLSEYLSS